MLEISCAKARAALISPPELLTAGMAKVVTVHFAFSPDWDSLRKTAVFSDGWRTVDVLEATWTESWKLWRRKHPPRSRLPKTGLPRWKRRCWS